MPTSVTATEYGPFDAGAGSTVGEAQWGRIMGAVLTDGVSPDILDELAVSQNSPVGMSVLVATGQGFVQGHQGRFETTSALDIGSNSSGSTRYDSVVLRSNRSTNVVEVAVVAGTAASASASPTLTQTSTVWEVELARITVANGATSIATASITDKRPYAGSRTNVGDICGLTGNASGATMVSSGGGSYTPLTLTWGTPVGAPGYFSAGQPTRVTCQDQGLHYLRANCSFINPTGSTFPKVNRRLQFFVYNAAGVVNANKTLALGFEDRTSAFPANAAEYIAVNGISVLDPGDYVEVVAYQDSGSNWTAQFGALTIARIGRVDATNRFS